MKRTKVQSFLRRLEALALAAGTLWAVTVTAGSDTASAALSALAADQHRQARRLSAAYFLLSGLRYWPTESLPAPMIPSFWGALRQRHQAEQQSELSYRLAADDTDDSTLLELYDQLMEGCRNHCRQLRNLLEQNCL